LDQRRRKKGNEDGLGHRLNKAVKVSIAAVFDDQAAWIKENVSKGQPVVAEGRINNSSYEKDGETVYTTDLVATTFNAFQVANANSND